MVKPITEQPQAYQLLRQNSATSPKHARHAHGARSTASTASTVADNFATATAAPSQAAVAPHQALPAAPTASGVATARSITRATSQVPKEAGSQHLKKDYTQALNNPNEGAKTAFLGRFNATYAPHLTTEDAAMQNVAQHLAYMHLPRGAAVAFNVQTTLDGVPEESYPREAVVRDSVMDSREHGVKAHILWPRDEADPVRNRVVIAFKGTGAYDKHSINNKEASGITADLDERGIGHAGFRNMEDEVLKHLHTALLQGRPVTITGHSLGGACAVRLLSMLEPTDQNSVKLITFGAPHLDAATAAKIKPKSPDVRCFQTLGDHVPKAGEAEIPARYFQTQSKAWLPTAKHGDISLIHHDLDDASTPIRKYVKEGSSSFTKPSKLVESGRRYFAGWGNGSAK